MPSLPEGLKLIETVLPGMHHFGVFCSQRIFNKGTRFGPFTGVVVATGDAVTVDRGDNWEVGKTTEVVEFPSFYLYCLGDQYVDTTCNFGILSSKGNTFFSSITAHTPIKLLNSRLKFSIFYRITNV